MTLSMQVPQRDAIQPFKNGTLHCINKIQGVTGSSHLNLDKPKLQAPCSLC